MRAFFRQFPSWNALRSEWRRTRYRLLLHHPAPVGHASRGGEFLSFSFGGRISKVGHPSTGGEFLGQVECSSKINPAPQTIFIPLQWRGARRAGWLSLPWRGGRRSLTGWRHA